jgi:hypothetical protein
MNTLWAGENAHGSQCLAKAPVVAGNDCFSAIND